MIYRLPIAGLVFLLLSGASALSVDAEQAMPMAFDVLRDGVKIGERTTVFHWNGADLVAETRLDIAVHIAFVTVYRRAEWHRETWRDGDLIAFSGFVEENGNRYPIAGRRTDKGLAVSGPNGVYMAPAHALLATYWNPRSMRTQHLIDLTRGALLEVSARRLGDDDVIVAGRPVRATRYRLKGDNEQQYCWYTEDGTLVRVRFQASDGSTIDFHSKSVELADRD